MAYKTWEARSGRSLLQMEAVFHEALPRLLQLFARPLNGRMGIAALLTDRRLPHTACISITFGAAGTEKSRSLRRNATLSGHAVGKARLIVERCERLGVGMTALNSRDCGGKRITVEVQLTHATFLQALGRSHPSAYYITRKALEQPPHHRSNRLTVIQKRKKSRVPADGMSQRLHAMMIQQ